MSQDALKQQFQLLQEQQKKRLIKQNKKKVEEQCPSYCNCSVEGHFDSFDGVEDQLNLQLQDNKDTDHFKDLEETVRELRDENGRLNKLLGERDEEIKIVRRRWKEDKKELAGGGIGSENAASKIIEFSKRIRELTSELEKEKRKSQNFKRKVDELEKNASPLAPKPKPTKEEREAEETELSVIRDKLNHALLKSAEERNEIDALRRELKIAQKVLTREVGENATFQTLLNSSSGWRGRQQQILGLQLKVTDLQQQLAANERSNSGKSSSRNAMLNGISHHDEKHRLSMRKIEIERKEQHEKLHRELEAVTLERDSFKEKNSAARARNKILTQDMKNLKEKIATLIEKGKHDDELVSALLREQQYLKEESERLKKELAKKESSSHGERVLRASGNFSIENNETNVLVDKLKEEIKDQEEKVKQLESEITNLKNNRSGYIDQSFIPKPPSSSGRKGERNTRRPYSGNSALEKDPLELQLQEAKSVSAAAFVEKEKLGELVQVLQRRNEELVEEMLLKDFTLSEYKNSNAKLEKHVEKLFLSQNNNSVVRVRGGSGNKKSQLVKSATVEEVQDALMEAETKLSIQMDNNDALKEALSTTLKAKEDDLKAFHDMVEQTKKIFLQGLRQYRQTVVLS